MGRTRDHHWQRMLRAACNNVASFWNQFFNEETTLDLPWLSPDLPVSPRFSPLVRTYGNDSSRDFASFTVCLAYTNEKYEFGEVDDCFGDESLRLNRPLDVARWVTDDRVALVDQCKRQTGSGLLDRIWEEVAKGEVVAK